MSLATRSLATALLAPLTLALACGDKDGEDEETGDDGSATVCYDEDLGGEVAAPVAEPELDGDDYSGMCNDERLGDDAPDWGYTWTAPRTTGYTFTTSGSPYDSVLFVLDGDCNGEILACNDDISFDNLASEVYVSLTEGQTVVIVVDGADAYASGTGSLLIFEDL